MLPIDESISPCPCPEQYARWRSGWHGQDCYFVLSDKLLEIKDRRLVDTPQLLPLQSTTFYEVEITNPETEIPYLAEQYPDAQKALVRYILHWDSSTQDRERYCQQIEKIFPRWYTRTLKDKRSGAITEASLTFHQVHDVRGTTLHYLQNQLTNNQDREELLRLAEELFVEEELV